jgi:hypothetical protein
MATKRRTGLDWLRYAEPARLRAAWVALISVLAAVGITVGTATDAKVGTVIGLIGAVLAITQGEWTRTGVYSPETHERAVLAAANSRPPVVDPV